MFFLPQVYEFADKNIKGIKMLWCGENEVDSLAEAKLTERYSTSKTIDGTQSFHYFKPIPETENVAVKRVSSDLESKIKKTSK